VYNASFISFTNKNVKFKDLLKVDQKIIVLDFWASWCVPCVAEIPMLKSHTKKLTDIKFISISLDKESVKWVEACNKYDIRSNSFRIVDVSNNELLKYFGIRYIPRFIVMTNKGEILSDDFYRPSDTKFEIDLKRMMADYK
jgi:thiol-disulfide isomerase/thioredoxin